MEHRSPSSCLLDLLLPFPPVGRYRDCRLSFLCSHRAVWRHTQAESQMAWLRCQLHLWLKDYNQTQSPLCYVFYFARGERYNQGPCQQPFTLPVSQSPAAGTHSWRRRWQVAPPSLRKQDLKAAIIFRKSHPAILIHGALISRLPPLLSSCPFEYW